MYRNLYRNTYNTQFVIRSSNKEKIDFRLKGWLFNNRLWNKINSLLEQLVTTVSMLRVMICNVSQKH